MNSGPESCTGIGVVAWLFVILRIRTWLREKHERRWPESPNMAIIQLVKETLKLATTYPRDEARGQPSLPAHRVRDGRPRPPSSPRSQTPPPPSPATPALAPAHPRPVSPYPTAPGTKPTPLHALQRPWRTVW